MSSPRLQTSKEDPLRHNSILQWTLTGSGGMLTFKVYLFGDPWSVLYAAWDSCCRVYCHDARVSPHRSRSVGRFSRRSCENQTGKENRPGLKISPHSVTDVGRFSNRAYFLFLIWSTSAPRIRGSRWFWFYPVSASTSPSTSTEDDDHLSKSDT